MAVGASPGTRFRSEPMSLIQLYMPIEITQEALYQLGELGVIEFCDLNVNINAFERPYIRETTRLEEVEQKFTYIWDRIKESNMFTSVSLKKQVSEIPFYKRQELENLGQSIGELYTRLKKINDSIASLGENYMQFCVKARILREVQRYISHETISEFSVDGTNDDGTTDRGDRETTNVTATKFLFVAGIIRRRLLPLFEQIVFRILRGNSFMQFSEIPEEVSPTGEKLSNMVVFAIFVHGSEVLRKVEKICFSICYATMRIDCYYDEIEENASEYERKCENLSKVIVNIKSTLNSELTAVSEVIDTWTIVIAKAKSIFTVLSMFKTDANTSRKTLIGEGWCPTNKVELVRECLRNITKQSGGSIGPFLSVLRTKGRTPPTYIKTNKFWASSQEIVNSYSVPAYQEINPGLFTIITFPFLFSVMFGDLGHGAIVALFGLWLIIKENKFDREKSGEILALLHSGRYMLLLMGIFSIYTGLIYSDAFSLPVKLFSSGWVSGGGGKSEMRQVGVYALGIDPAWHDAENSLMFINSYKMKLSIVLGMIHMIFGLSLNVFNYIQSKEYHKIITQFIPELLFMLSIFGYLAFLIIFKWCTHFDDPENAPSILNVVISMMLSPGSLQESNRLYSGQLFVQTFLLLLAVICVPWMLLAQPMYGKFMKKEKSEKYSPVVTNPTTSSSNNVSKAGYDGLDNDVVLQMPQTEEPVEDEIVATDDENEEDLSMSDIIIHKGIHTMEFCLNAMSNTASYLRLWALSLAHAELSKLNWDMVLAPMLKTKGIIAPFVIALALAFWAALTIAILVCMEGLSAFLHALRLHWIEFQGKFYTGNGVPFSPFSFKTIPLKSGSDTTTT